MNSIMSEKEYQKFILEKLEQENGYIIRPAASYSRLFALDREMLFQFLEKTQPDQMAEIRKVYKDKTEGTVVNFINTEITKDRGSLLNVLKNGVEIANQKLALMYAKPASEKNPLLVSAYRENIFSVMEEVWASDNERIDLVIFLNGFAIASFELKCNLAGQSYEDAIKQYRLDRNPQTRLFLFKAGTLVNFAMDLQEVYMATRLEGKNTYFLPFNMGNGEGINTGKGNPIYEDKYSVCYMWEDILKKDTILELIKKYIFIEIDEKTGKEKIVFPRYHQLDCIRKLLADVGENKSKLNYLIQHSAGSGKTNTIAWLAHWLVSLHDQEDRIIFDTIVICTDRIVVDNQLQRAILNIEHKSGLIRVMNKECTSDDLRIALESNTKIIATTIQKFLYIADNTRNLKDKRFAVIIDEAHSSTAGKDMAALTQTLSTGDIVHEYETIEDQMAADIARNGKQPNVSMFAFTATPKPTTLQFFGRINEKGYHEAFHLYSMKQAIEEGFILDVLQNYVTYKTFYQINKEIENDPKCRTVEAKRQIARFVENHETNIAQRVEVIIEHFRTTVMEELDGNAKAMVVTPSRENAVKYRQAFEEYINEKGYQDIRALVAFSGTVKDRSTEIEYTESGMNGFPEDKLPERFDTPEYSILIVANKYQVGYDQPKLCAMYILKGLKGVAAVQTLSRLNRICPPYDKHTFVLDFVNSYEDIEKSFSRYYTATFLANSITPTDIYNLEAKIDGYYVINPQDVEDFNILLSKPTQSARDKKQMEYFLAKCQKLVSQQTPEDQHEFMAALRHFLRFYSFLIQVTCFEDVELHKKYRFIDCLEAYLNISGYGPGFDLTGKIRASGFVQKKDTEHKNEKKNANPIIKLPTADDFGMTPDKEKRLSEIIDEINSRTGKQYDNDIAVKAMLQIRDLLMKSDKLKISAKTNTQSDFEFTFYDDIDQALIEGLSQNQEFFTMLLENEDLKKKVLGIFSSEIYRSLRNEPDDVIREGELRIAEQSAGFNSDI